MEIPHYSQNVHSGETHAQHVVAEAGGCRVGIGTDGSLGPWANEVTPGSGLSWKGSPVFLPAFVLKVRGEVEYKAPSNLLGGCR